MGYKVDNAIIMAAGLSSRFAPLSYERPKALISVKGDVLIERQIRQLHEANIRNIIVVVGYLKEQFFYLKEKYGVMIVENKEYATRNNNSTIYAVRDYLRNSYICSADNFFSINPFEEEVDEAYYAALYATGKTDEWCLQLNENDWITGVTVGGTNHWYMLGHVFWTENFSREFLKILNNEYDKAETKNKLWEAIYIEHLDSLKLKVRRYQDDEIYEFDTLDELRVFDKQYWHNSESVIINSIAKDLNCGEEEFTEMKPVKDDKGYVYGFKFTFCNHVYRYHYADKKLEKVEE